MINLIRNYQDFTKSASILLSVWLSPRHIFKLVLCSQFLYKNKKCLAFRGMMTYHTIYSHKTKHKVFLCISFFHPRGYKYKYINFQEKGFLKHKFISLTIFYNSDKIQYNIFSQLSNKISKKIFWMLIIKLYLSLLVCITELWWK